MRTIKFLFIVALCLFWKSGFAQDNTAGKIGFSFAYTPVFPERYLGLNFGVQYNKTGGVFFQYNQQKDKAYSSYYGGWSARIPSEKYEVYFTGGIGRSDYKAGKDRTTYLVGFMQILHNGIILQGGHTWHPNGQMLFGLGYMIR